MRIATIHDMMTTLKDMFPVTFSTPKLESSWEQQYRASLSGLDGDQLNAAWHKCLDGWTKKAAPSPADFLIAHRSAPGSKLSSRDSSGLSFADRLKQRDEKLREARHAITAEWESHHPKVVSAATAEGWLPHLQGQLAIGSNMLAQRNRITEDKGRNPILSKGDEEYFGIYPVDGVEQLCITQAMIDLWRSYGPSKMPPARSSTFDQVGAAA